MVRHSLVNVAVLIGATALGASRCDAWNSTGHEVVAQIAYDQLSPSAKTAIVGTLKFHPRLDKDLLADEVRAKDDDLAMFLRAATWPDMVRYPTNPLTHTENHPKWHYVDFPFEQDGVKGPQPVLEWDGKSDPANLLQAMQKVEAELKNPQTAKDRKAIDICWVEHLVGDIHQPLHATSWFSKEFPQGDQGGNQVSIRDATNQVINLHSHWDGIEGMSMDPEQIRKIADRIEAEHPLAQMKDQVADLAVFDWAQESSHLAQTVIYQNGTLPHALRSESTTRPELAPSLPAGYDQKGIDVADERVALAGYRLAATLEDIAKGL